MAEHGGELSLERQCELLGVGRPSLYRELAGESESSLALMRRVDELYMDSPFHGSRQMARHLRREETVGPAPRSPADAADPSEGGVPEAADQRAALGAQGVPVPAPRRGGGAEVWCADITYVPVRSL